MVENTTETGNPLQVLLRDILLCERCLSQMEHELLTCDTLNSEKARELSIHILGQEITRAQLYHNLSTRRNDLKKQKHLSEKLVVLGEIERQIQEGNNLPLAIFIKSRSQEAEVRAAKSCQDERRAQLLSLSEKYKLLASLL